MQLECTACHSVFSTGKLWQKCPMCMEGKLAKHFKPILIGTAVFANGTEFKIEQVNKRGACRITNTVSGTQGHSHNIANAWASVRYQARVLQHTERSS